jgi:hypothetical protein
VAVSLLEHLKAFISGVFAGMANSQAKHRDYPGTRWRARIAMRWATQPYSKVFANAVSAKAEMIGKNRRDARRHVEEALSLIKANPEIQALEEVKAMRSELEAMQRELL